MRKLQDTELFSLHLSDTDKANMQYAMINKLSKSNIGVIAPENIEAELTQLKIKAKAGQTGILSEAIQLFESFNGRIKLFNLGTSSIGRSPVPIFIPFIVGMSRNRSLENDKDMRPTTPTVFMNMYRIGNWNAEENQYIGFSAITDLYTELESGLIMYKLLVDGKADSVLSNKKIIETLTNIYTFMFNRAVIKSSQSVFSSGDFMLTATQYLIANFFLRYVLQLQADDTIADYAYNVTDGKASLTALKDFEKSVEIDYTSLSGFLKTLGIAIFSEPMSLVKFEMGWITTYGESLLLAIEYLPYFIHFLLSVIHGSSLGGMSRMMMHKQTLNKKGLDLFYRTLISEIR